MEFQKRYQQLTLFLLCFFAVLIFATVGAELLVSGFSLRVSVTVVALGMALLTVVVEKTQCVHWYNGVSFEEARDAGSERRLQFAAAYRRRFVFFALLMLSLSVLFTLLSVSSWVDFSVGFVGLCAVAISTVNLKL